MFMAMVFWGGSFIWTDILLENYNPLTIILVRLILSTIFLFTVGIVFKKLQRLKLKDLRIIMLLGFFEPFLYFVGETYGLENSSATVTSVLIATIPLFSPFAAWIFFKEKFNVLNIVGIVISVLGVFLVIMNNNYELKTSLIGILLLGLAVFSALGYSVVVINVTKRYNVFSIIFYQNIIGIIFVFPFFMYFDFESFISVGISLELLKPFLALAILASSIAFMFFTYGIRELGLVKANTIANIIPVFTAIFSYYFLNEILSSVNILGIMVVLSGLLLSQLKKGMYLKNKIIPLRRVKIQKK